MADQDWLTQQVAGALAQAGTQGGQTLVFVTWRQREPGRRVHVARGLSGEVVETRRDGGEIRVTVLVTADDARRWLARRQEVPNA